MRRNLLNTSVCALRGQDSGSSALQTSCLTATSQWRNVVTLIVFDVSCPDQLHSVPIAQMGNYQDFLKAAPQPLRDADPEQPKRLHTFGNPFKLDKKVRPLSHAELICCQWTKRDVSTSLSSSQGMMIDEADEFVTGPQSKGKRPADNCNNMPGGGPKRRRCMSPLLRLGRAYTPPVTPPTSPRHPSGKSLNQEIDTNMIDKRNNSFLPRLTVKISI